MSLRGDFFFLIEFCNHLGLYTLMFFGYCKYCLCLEKEFLKYWNGCKCILLIMMIHDNRPTNYIKNTIKFPRSTSMHHILRTFQVHVWLFVVVIISIYRLLLGLDVEIWVTLEQFCECIKVPERKTSRRKDVRLTNDTRRFVLNRTTFLR